MNDNEQNQIKEHLKNERNQDTSDKNGNNQKKNRTKNKRKCSPIKFGLIVITLYLLFLLIYSAKPQISVYITFISFIASLLLGPINFFLDDKKFGILAALGISLGFGIVIGDCYVCPMFQAILPAFFQKDNIGNVLSVLALYLIVGRYILDLKALKDSSDDKEHHDLSKDE